MSCFKLPSIPSIGTLPALPSIKFPNPRMPHIPDLSIGFPKLSFPFGFFDLHPNFCDILLLIFLLYMIITGWPKPTDSNGNELPYNPTRAEALTWVESITQNVDAFGVTSDINITPIVGTPGMQVFSNVVIVYPMDTDPILQSIKDNYDSNNEFASTPNAKIEAIFELNGLDASYIPEYYNNKKFNKLTRI